MAGRLGLVTVREAAMRKAAAGLEEIAAGECDKLALDEVEELPGMAEEAEVGQ